MLKAIIFDMDGVLIDTPKLVWATHNKLLSKFKKHVPDSKIPEYLGRSLKDQIKLFGENLNIVINTEDYIHNFETETLQHLEKITKNVSLINLIKNLEDKFLLAVATSSSRSRAGLILNRLGVKDYFQIIITAEDVKKHKPAPDLFLEAARRLEVKPTECVVVEDAANGIEAAKNANMRVIALKTEFQSEKELKNADMIINNLSEIETNKLEKLF